MVGKHIVDTNLVYRLSMNDRHFLNNDIVKITGATPRQVLGWTEKGLIIPFKETLGAGSKRVYDYVNVLEICLCKYLFDMAHSVQSIKKVLNELRRREIIKEWALNFNKYYLDLFKRQKDAAQNLIDEAKECGDEEKYKSFTKMCEVFLAEPRIPEKPVGILMIFYSKNGEEMHVIPYSMDFVMNLDIVKKDFVKSFGATLIDLGKLKAVVDSKIE